MMRSKSERYEIEQGVIMKNVGVTLLVVAFLLHLTCLAKASTGDIWSWVYHKILSANERVHSKDKQTLLFGHTGVPEFTQLIFAWNAFRPEKGHFSFWVQARNALTKEWGKWHKMIDWGAGVQCSYTSPSDGHTQYLHVRLETENNKFADGFRIKVLPHEGATLDYVHGVAASTSNFTLFKPEAIDKHLKQLASVRISQVPQLSQFALKHANKDRICSPTSCTMLMRFLLKEQIDPLEFADKVFDTGLNAYGSWPFNTAHAFERAAGAMWFLPVRLNSFQDLHHQLNRGIPVVVSVRGRILRAPKPYPNGHLLVVVGFDARRQEVICHDPAFSNNAKTVQRYAVSEFIRAWERSYRLAYWVEPLSNTLHA